MNGMAPQPVIAVIDDDSAYQFIASKTLKATKLVDQIIPFLNGREALNFLAHHYQNPEKLPDIIFLDINMPVTDGWMFLDEFCKVKGGLVKKIRIYMVSSSIDQRDINRARNNPEVSAYVEKPISVVQYAALLEEFGAGIN